MIPNETFTIRDAIRGIFKQMFLVVFLFLLIIGIVGAATLLSTKVYESQAKVFVRLGRENVGLDPTSTLGEGTVVATPMSREAEINSVVHLIRNRDLYEKIVAKFGAEQILDGKLEGVETSEPTNPSLLDQAKEKFKQAKNVLDGAKEQLKEIGILNEVSVHETAIIKVQKNLDVKALDHSNVILISYECESPEMARDVVAFLLEEYRILHAKLHRPSGALEFLRGKTTEIQKNLIQREQELEAFKSTSGMVSAELQKGSFVDRVSSVEKQLREAVVKVAALTFEVRAIKASNADYLEGGEMHNTLRIQEIIKDAQLQAEKERVKELNEQLKLENDRLETFAENEMTFSNLTRRLQIQDEKYRRYERNLAQASLDHSLEESNLSNISVSQQASFNEKPIRPNKLINLIAGVILACGGSFGTAVLRAYLYPERIFGTSAPADSAQSPAETEVDPPDAPQLGPAVS